MKKGDKPEPKHHQPDNYPNPCPDIDRALKKYKESKK